eukprot:TRINITY_DN994_c0_g2_i1.p1 TRINITY_DN994_c0_g2~~TRINITY_DN994_c0_g2_i1.p1  ORF type:complete len:224 (+),score=39.19 TRINITY_DN994_c0_g2_i1:103-774(+)
MNKVLVLVLGLAASCADGFYTRLVVGEQRCFVEEVGPVIDAVTVRYNTSSSNVRWEVKHQNTIVMDIIRKDKIGSFEFLTLQDREGQYDICVTAFREDNASLRAESETLRLIIDKSDRHRLVDLQRGTKPLIESFSEDRSAQELIAEDLERSAVYLQDILIEIHDLKQEAAAMVIRQNRFKDRSDGTFNRIVYLSCLTCFVVTAVFYLEYLHLKSFLRAKKLV